LWLLTSAWNTPDSICWWVAPIYQQTHIAFDRLAGWLRQADAKQRVWSLDKSTLTVTLANGSRIVCKSGDNPDGLYGEDVNAAVVDEASRCKEDVWNAVRSTLTATRGKVRVIGNVRGRKNWAWRLARMAEAGAADMAFHRLTCSDAIVGGIMDQAEVDAARAVLPEAVFRELYLAEPADDLGCPFDAGAIRRCIAPLSTDPVVAFGVDLAKSHDWSVAVGLDASGRVARLERWQGDWGATRSRLAAMIGDTPALIDSTGVGDPIVEELQRSLVGVEGFKFSATSKQQLMEGLAANIQSHAVAFPEGWLVHELLAFEYEYARTGVRYTAPQGVHDDGVCALALAVRKWSTRPMNDLTVRIL
jgi:phage FluMu gp28-like protein